MNHHFQTYLHALRQFNRDVRLYLLTTVLISLVSSGNGRCLCGYTHLRPGYFWLFSRISRREVVITPTD